ncbi:MAG: MoaD/ThiS family protein [Burkholderiales bacterium]
MARVVFTSNLQRHVRCPESRVAPGTVASALAEVFAAQPWARSYVLDEQGQLRRHVTVFVDGTRVRDRDRLSDPVGESSEVYVMQALTGG